MAVIEFPDRISRLMARADFRELSAGVDVRVVPGLPAPFAVDDAGAILLDPARLAAAPSDAVTLRHALELLMLRRMWPGRYALAGLAAARTAALFARLEPPDPRAAADRTDDDPGAAALVSDTPLTAAAAAALWRVLARHQPGAPGDLAAGTGRLLARVWPLLGPAEWLMQDVTGRLAAAPARERSPTSASGRSPASASAPVTSERGRRGAETMRRAILADIPTDPDGIGSALAGIRGVIRTAYGLPPGTFVALAPSGVACELFVLAAAQAHPAGRPLTMVLMEEAGGCIPVAASGRHVAADTVRGASVTMGAVIEGFRDDIEVRGVALRTRDGAARPPGDVAADCERLAGAAVAALRRVVLHRADTSETGLLAPDMAALRGIQQRHAGWVDIVVDATAARLSPDRVLDYLSLNWIVMLSGSGFLTGPSPSGAVLFPETLRDRFGRPMPHGLRDYSARADWPPSLAAVRGLPPGGDVGLALRWAAALAELRAFNAVPAAEQQHVIGRFVSGVRSAIAGNADLRLIEAPAPRRARSDTGSPASGEMAWDGRAWDGTGWDEIGTVLSFAVRDPAGPGWLPPDAAARVGRRLDADLAGRLPVAMAPACLALARRRFRLGPPLALSLEGREVGVLRISADARLVSGEPPPAACSPAERLAREVGDAEALLRKISLILRHGGLLDDDVPPSPAIAPNRTGGA